MTRIWGNCAYCNNAKTAAKKGSGLGLAGHKLNAAIMRRGIKELTDSIRLGERPGVIIITIDFALIEVTGLKLQDLIVSICGDFPTVPSPFDRHRHHVAGEKNDTFFVQEVLLDLFTLIEEWETVDEIYLASDGGGHFRCKDTLAWMAGARATIFASFARLIWLFYEANHSCNVCDGLAAHGNTALEENQQVAVRVGERNPLITGADGVATALGGIENHHGEAKSPVFRPKDSVFSAPAFKGIRKYYVFEIKTSGHLYAYKNYNQFLVEGPHEDIAIWEGVAAALLQHQQRPSDEAQVPAWEAAREAASAPAKAMTAGFQEGDRVRIEQLEKVNDDVLKRQYRLMKILPKTPPQQKKEVERLIRVFLEERNVGSFQLGSKGDTFGDPIIIPDNSEDRAMIDLADEAVVAEVQVCSICFEKEATMRGEAQNIGGYSGEDIAPIFCEDCNASDVDVYLHSGVGEFFNCQTGETSITLPPVDELNEQGRQRVIVEGCQIFYQNRPVAPQ